MRFHEGSCHAWVAARPVLDGSARARDTTERVSTTRPPPRQGPLDPLLSHRSPRSARSPQPPAPTSPHLPPLGSSLLGLPGELLFSPPPGRQPPSLSPSLRTTSARSPLPADRIRSFCHACTRHATLAPPRSLSPAGRVPPRPPPTHILWRSHDWSADRRPALSHTSSRSRRLYALDPAAAPSATSDHSHLSTPRTGTTRALRRHRPHRSARSRRLAAPNPRHPPHLSSPLCDPARSPRRPVPRRLAAPPS